MLSKKKNLTVELQEMQRARQGRVWELRGQWRQHPELDAEGVRGGVCQGQGWHGGLQAEKDTWSVQVSIGPSDNSRAYGLQSLAKDCCLPENSMGQAGLIT